MSFDYRVRCDEIVERVSDYLEGALDPRDVEALEHHVVICAGCADYLAQMRAIVARSERLRAADAPDDAALARVRALFAAVKREEER